MLVSSKERAEQTDRVLSEMGLTGAPGHLPRTNECTGGGRTMQPVSPPTLRSRPACGPPAQGTCGADTGAKPLGSEVTGPCVPSLLCPRLTRRPGCQEGAFRVWGGRPHRPLPRRGPAGAAPPPGRGPGGGGSVTGTGHQGTLPRSQQAWPSPGQGQGGQRPDAPPAVGDVPAQQVGWKNPPVRART